MEPAMRPAGSSLTPTLGCSPDKKVRRAWAGGTDSTGRGEGLQTRHSTSSYLRTNNTETMQRKQEKVCEGRKRREK